MRLLWGEKDSIFMIYRSENCVNYLTAWGVDIDAQDNNGCTALHHAAIGVIEANHVHIIMSLLIGGADRSIKVIKILKMF
jgi:ankyrin repeat protein